MNVVAVSRASLPEGSRGDYARDDEITVGLAIRGSQTHAALAFLVDDAFFDTSGVSIASRESASRESAAIQPDMSAMGMPGPG